jgi:RAD51-like protein 3
MRLAALTHLISKHHLDVLTSAGIYTHTDLLFHPNIYAQLPAGTITRQEISDYVSRVAAHTAAQPLSFNAGLMHEEDPLRDHSSPLSTGLPGLDDVLQLLGHSQVHEISGDRGSGKTTLVLQASLHTMLKDPLCSVVWIDTTGDFSPERCLPLLDPAIDASWILDRLQISLALDADSLFELLDAIESSTKLNLTHIVIDNLTAILTPLLTAVSAQGHSIMTGLMRQLRLLARSKKLTILTLNNSTSNTHTNPGQLFQNYSRKPALGPSFTYMSDSTLWLSKPDRRSNRVKIELVRSTFSGAGKSCVCLLDNGLFREG